MEVSGKVENTELGILAHKKWWAIFPPSLGTLPPLHQGRHCQAATGIGDKATGRVGKKTNSCFSWSSAWTAEKGWCGQGPHGWEHLGKQPETQFLDSWRCCPQNTLQWCLHLESHGNFMPQLSQVIQAVLLPKNQGRGVVSCCHYNRAPPQQHPRANQFPLQIPLPTFPSHAVSAGTLAGMARAVPRSGQDIISPKDRFGERLAQQICSNICGWTPSSGNHSSRHGASPPPMETPLKG